MSTRTYMIALHSLEPIKNAIGSKDQELLEALLNAVGDDEDFQRYAKDMITSANSMNSMKNLLNHSSKQSTAKKQFSWGPTEPIAISIAKEQPAGIHSIRPIAGPQYPGDARRPHRRCGEKSMPAIPFHSAFQGGDF